MNAPQEISPIELGERLRIARETAKLKQADAAEKIGVARTTLVAMEQGQRKVKFGELQQLAKLYNISINALFRQEAIFTDLAPKFRKLTENNSDVEKAVKLLSDLVSAEIEMENLLGIRRVHNYPPERPIMPGDVRAQAEQDASELRQRLGLGQAPISDIVTLLEMELGIRVYIRRLDGKISGLFAYDEILGACILLNANHPRERRTLTAGHETGHFIGTRRNPEVLELQYTDNSREERYADAFGRALLMPARGVMQKFKEVIAGSSTLTRRHVIILSHFFKVSREALVRRLEELELTKSGTWDWFISEGGISDDQARQVLGDLALPDEAKGDANRPTTLRLSSLAAEVYRQGLLSEGQLARLLHLDRIELRSILDGQESEGSPINGAFTYN